MKSNNNKMHGSVAYSNHATWTGSAGKKRSCKNLSVSWKLRCCILDTPTLLAYWLLFELINRGTFHCVFHYLEWAQSWPFNPPGPGPEPCWTPYKKFEFGPNDLRFPSKTSLVFFVICLFPLWPLFWKKKKKEKFDKLCDVKSQNFIY